jgi:hypothetical protein
MPFRFRLQHGNFLPQENMYVSDSVDSSSHRNSKSNETLGDLSKVIQRYSTNYTCLLSHVESASTLNYHGVKTLRLRTVSCQLVLITASGLTIMLIFQGVNMKRVVSTH